MRRNQLTICIYIYDARFSMIVGDAHSVPNAGGAGYRGRRSIAADRVYRKRPAASLLQKPRTLARSLARAILTRTRGEHQTPTTEAKRRMNNTACIARSVTYYRREALADRTTSRERCVASLPEGPRSLARALPDTHPPFHPSPALFGSALFSSVALLCRGSTAV